jgi:hypothetical protein
MNYAHLEPYEEANRVLQSFQEIARNEIDPFPGEDSIEWRSYPEHNFKCRRDEDITHARVIFPFLGEGGARPLYTLLLPSWNVPGQ